jgi:hypothetical protein
LLEICCAKLLFIVVNQAGRRQVGFYGPPGRILSLHRLTQRSLRYITTHAGALRASKLTAVAQIAMALP